MNYAQLGSRIRLAREEALLSQDAVAHHLELPRSAVSLIESGKRKVDTLELERFSRLVGKSILFFFNEGYRAVEASNFEEDDSTQILLGANQVIDTVPPLEKVNQFPDEYTEMAFEAYRLGKISLSKLAELLEITLEEAKNESLTREIPLNLGINSELELLNDVENA